MANIQAEIEELYNTTKDENRRNGKVDDSAVGNKNLVSRAFNWGKIFWPR
jgi:hypothetical protein